MSACVFLLLCFWPKPETRYRAVLVNTVFANIEVKNLHCYGELVDAEKRYLLIGPSVSAARLLTLGAQVSNVWTLVKKGDHYAFQKADRDWPLSCRIVHAG